MSLPKTKAVPLVGVSSPVEVKNIIMLLLQICSCLFSGSKFSR